ncbi:MAG: fibronectin type III domain-containing protein [Nitrospira sp.]
MKTHVISINLVYKKFAIALAHLMMLSVIVLPLAGCGDDGGGAPPISSLSTPTEAPSGTDTPPGEVDGSDSTIPQNNVAESDHDNRLTELAELNPELSEEEEDPTISMTPTPAGVTARLSWDASTDPNVAGYHVYYGKESSGEPGSCSYEGSQGVTAPPATINGLEPNTPYFFAISAYGGEEGELESPCSNEVLVVTPPAQS